MGTVCFTSRDSYQFEGFFAVKCITLRKKLYILRPYFNFFDNWGPESEDLRAQNGKKVGKLSFARGLRAVFDNRWPCFPGRVPCRALNRLNLDVSVMPGIIGDSTRQLAQQPRRIWILIEIAGRFAADQLL